MSAPINNQAVQVLICLGSNINPEKNIIEAYKLLTPAGNLLKKSSVWQTAAVGSSGPDYLNAAALLETDHSLMYFREEVLKKIETSLGRIRTEDKYMDRTIDLDIIIYDGLEIDPELWTRAHIAVPASQVLPEYKNKITGETLKEASRRLSLKGTIIKRFDLP